MEKNKRVYCLYRVSTKGQVEKDDIPMQKQYCREFAESQGWTIIKEFAEINYQDVSCIAVFLPPVFVKMFFALPDVERDAFPFQAGPVIINQKRSRLWN